MIDEYQVSGVNKNTAVSDTIGNADRIADAIKSAVKDAHLAMDPYAELRCSVFVGEGIVYLMGSIRSNAAVDIDPLVRGVVQDAGYDRCELGFDYQCLEVLDECSYRSWDIRKACLMSEDPGGQVDVSHATSGQSDANFQGVIVGYASGKSSSRLDSPSNLARRITLRLMEVRESEIVPNLRPDGSVRVYVKYKSGEPVGGDAIALSTQHDPGVSKRKLEDDLMEHVILPVVPSSLLPSPERIIFNPAGPFVKGGPLREPGLSGRRCIFREYGNGPWNWEDVPRNDSLVHRWGALAARYVATILVSAELADRIEVQITYARGSALPYSISLETFGTGRVPNDVLIDRVNKHFDLRPSTLIRDLGITTPINRKVAYAGYFGRDDLGFPWERIDKAEVLR